jgi:hypothetical protein
MASGIEETFALSPNALFDGQTVILGIAAMPGYY